MPIYMYLLLRMKFWSLKVYILDFIIECVLSIKCDYQ